MLEINQGRGQASLFVGSNIETRDDVWTDQLLDWTGC